MSKVTAKELKKMQKKSGYEVEFGEWLELQRLQAKHGIVRYDYEPFSLELCPFNLVSKTTPTIYTPDFVVNLDVHGHKPRIYEVKGYVWSRDSVRLKWAAWRYGDKYDFFLVTKIKSGKHKGEWKIKRIGVK